MLCWGDDESNGARTRRLAFKAGAAEALEVEDESTLTSETELLGLRSSRVSAGAAISLLLGSRDLLDLVEEFVFDVHDVNVKGGEFTSCIPNSVWLMLMMKYYG